MVSVQRIREGIWPSGRLTGLTDLQSDHLGSRHHTRGERPCIFDNRTAPAAARFGATP